MPSIVTLISTDKSSQYLLKYDLSKNMISQRDYKLAGYLF